MANHRAGQRLAESPLIGGLNKVMAQSSKRSYRESTMKTPPLYAALDLLQPAGDTAGKPDHA
jgi:hypothetical protein